MTVFLIILWLFVCYPLDNKCFAPMDSLFIGFLIFFFKWSSKAHFLELDINRQQRLIFKQDFFFEYSDYPFLSKLRYFRQRIKLLGESEVFMYLLVHQYKNTLCPGSSDPIYKVSCYIIWVTTSWTHSMPGEQICKMQLFASWDVQKVLSIFIIDQRLVPNKPKIGIKKKIIILFRSTYSMCCKNIIFFFQ